MYWFDCEGKQQDVYVSTRIRLARNLCSYPFDPVLCETGAREIEEKVSGVLTPLGYKATGIEKMKGEARQALFEKHLISNEMVHKEGPCELYASEADGVYVMVCEEDHIRIQAIRPGLDFDGALEAAYRADEALDAKLNIAFDEKLGYLTHCPTNLGTGMRASVMMFLPALSMTDRIKGLESQLSKLGLTVRGTDGEGSAARGSLYQISNCVTLGVTEEEIITNLTSACESIAENERALRKKLAENRGDALRDRIMRSVGTAKYAYMISSEELYRLYADIRLGAALGYVDKKPHELDRLLALCQPAGIAEQCGRELTAAERDKERASRLAAEI